MSALFFRKSKSTQKLRTTKSHRLWFDALEERILLSVSGLPEIAWDTGETYSIGTEGAISSGDAEQATLLLGFEGGLDPTGDSVETGTRYRIFDGWGGTWSDAEKDLQAGDDLLCWAGAASNVLEWTGWGLVAGMVDTDQMFQYYQDHWTDEGNLPRFAWDWWFDGTNPTEGWSGWSQVDVPGGNFYPDSIPSDYIHTRGQGATAQAYAMIDIDQYSRAGYGVSLGIFGSIGHAITCWGFNYDTALAPSDPNYYQGIWITDSDDGKYTANGHTAPDVLHYYSVSWNSSYNRYDFSAYYPGSYIGEVDGLERLITSPAPDSDARADFDANGVSDILWHNQSTGEAGAWLLQNDGSDSYRWLGSASASVWKVAGIGDFDADGIADVLWHNQSNGEVGAWLVKNDAPNGWKWLGIASADVWKVAGVGDFDANGVSDVLWHNQSNGYAGAWLVYNDAPNGWKELGTASPDVWKVAGVGDYDANGTADVLWHNQSNGYAGVWLVYNDLPNGWKGLGSAPADTWTAIGTGDYDGNGVSDVLWHNQSTGYVGAWLVYNGAPNGWKGIGDASPSVWRPICGEDSPLLASNTISTDTGALSMTRSLTADSLAREAVVAWNASTIAAWRQDRFDSGSRLGTGTEPWVGSDSTRAPDPPYALLHDAAMRDAHWINRSSHEWELDAVLPGLCTVDPRALERMDLATVGDREPGGFIGVDALDRLAEDWITAARDIGFLT